MTKRSLTTVLGAAIVTAFAFGVYAVAGPGKKDIKADILTGYQEATPAGVSSNATGTFTAKIDDPTKTITYELTYTGLSGPALFSHIHFGNRYDSGGIAAFLCGGSTKPACPAGTTDVADVKGTITPSDVIGPAGQGIAAGEWDELVAAMRAGVTYANVHTPQFPMGEIRAQLNNEDQRQPASPGPGPGHDDDQGGPGPH